MQKLKRYKSKFEVETIFNDSFLSEIYLTEKIEEGFFGRIKNVKDVLKNVFKTVKKFSTKKYIPVKVLNNRMNIFDLHILYPDNNMGKLTFEYNEDENVLELLDIKGNNKLINHKQLFQIDVYDFLKFIKILSQYCYTKVFNSDYYDFDKMKHGKGFVHIG